MIHQNIFHSNYKLTIRSKWNILAYFLTFKQAWLNESRDCIYEQSSYADCSVHLKWTILYLKFERLNNSKLNAGCNWLFIWTFSLDYGDTSHMTKHLYICIHLLNGLICLDHL